MLAGIILTGGQSRRMGTDKALLCLPHYYHGVTLIEGITTVLTQSGCDPIIVVARQDQELPSISASIIYDTTPDQGPLVALKEGLEYARTQGAKQAFVCAVDMPCITSELIELLIQQPPASIVIPTDTHHHYLAALYQTDLVERIQEHLCQGQRRLGALVQSVTIQEVALPEHLRHSVTNLNTPEDIAHLGNE